MNSSAGLVILIILMASALVIPGTALDTVSGDMGWYVIHCNVPGANVYLDDRFVGATDQATLTVPASTSGTPYKVFRVQKYGYSTFTDTISQVPDKGGIVNLYATLNALPATTVTSLGGDMGWYIVHCNIEGASVYFDSASKGEISRGMVYVPVYSTGTPYKSFTVKKDGYSTYEGSISNVPAKGESIDLYATLNPSVVTTTGSSPLIGGDIGYYRVHVNTDGATVSFDNEEKGKSASGILTVPVYVTGTPYRTFMVYKAGYIPFSGTIDTYPAKGQTIDLYATLNPLPGTPVVTTTQKSPVSAVLPCVAVVISGIAVILLLTKRE